MVKNKTLAGVWTELNKGVNTIKRLNEWLFGFEEISFHDKAWFYGSYTLIVLLVGFVAWQVNL